MNKKAIFYHAGCSVCVNAEQRIATALERQRMNAKSRRGDNPRRLLFVESAKRNR